MLANLDNEIIFQKAFTNKTVFKAFVRDILGIEISPLTPSVAQGEIKSSIYA